MAVKDIRLIALDIDGTILTSDAKLSARTYKVLKAASKKGIRIILATGRILTRTLPILKELGIEDFVVVHNGAVVFDNRTNQIIQQRGIPLEQATALIRQLEQQRLIYYVFTGETGGEKVIAPDYVGQVGQDLLMQYSGETGSLVPQLKLEAEPVRITIIDNPVSVGPFYEMLQRDYEDSTTPILFGTSTDPVQGIEIMPPSCSKGSGVATICQEIGISMQNVLAFGDNNNDLEMLKMAGIGVAMGNAFPQVQAVADRVALTNDDDGVAQLIEELVLNKE